MSVCLSVLHQVINIHPVSLPFHCPIELRFTQHSRGHFGDVATAADFISFGLEMAAATTSSDVCLNNLHMPTTR